MPLKKSDLIAFESEISELFSSGQIKAPIHLSHGNEDDLLNIFSNIQEDDWVFSTHRNHYHALLKGVPPHEIKSQIVERKNSITLNSLKHKFLTSAIMGGIIPIALGTALACKLSKKNTQVWVFVGDMASEMGIFHEAVKYAEGHDLPIHFVVEDNGKSVCTNTSLVWGASKTPSKVIRYSYSLDYPHQGVGKWVTF